MLGASPKGIGTTLGTLRSISTTPTNAVATGLSSQKKEATLSTGREVVVIGDTTTNAQFWWSDDDWATKTNYSVDIAGWSNGSIACYVDSGGTERLVAVWKQSGTGGGRTSGNSYIVTGAFNAGRTTITWGTVIDHIANSNYDFPDVVVYAEGTGGTAHTVYCLVTATPETYAFHKAFTINSSGAMTGGSSDNIGGSYDSAGAWMYPSICIDPATKDLHMAWSAPGSGSGKGIRYRRAAYMAYTSGAWTYATEVEVDSTRYVVNTARYVVSRWNSHDSMVVIGGLIYDGANNDLMQYESTNFTSFTTRTLSNDVSSGNAVFEGGMAIDSGTGDSYFAGRNGAQSDVAYYKWKRSTTTLGSRVVIEAANVTTPYVYVWARTTKIGFLWTALNSSPYTVKAAALT